MTIKPSLKYALIIIILGFTLGLILGLVSLKAHGKTPPAQIDKKIFNPARDTYVDNMDESEHHFASQEIVTFRIIIKNTGEAVFNSVSVTDVFPAFITFLSGIGRFENGKLTIDAGDLEPDASQEFIIRGQVPQDDQLPADKAVICTENKVEMRSQQEAILASDTTGLCIEHKVLGVKTPPKEELPATGSTGLLLAIPLFGGLEIVLRRYA